MTLPQNLISFVWIAITVCLFEAMLCASPELAFQFDSVDYLWDSSHSKDSYIRERKFIVENNIITGIKIWKDQVFVTVPRWRPGVPATMNRVVTGPSGAPVLEPFPSWAENDLDNIDAIQYTQSMEIDSRGWMWILDVGRLDLLTPKPIDNLGPKLVIYDLEKKCRIRTFIFPDSVLSWNNSFANDLVVDETHGYAYISDTWANGGVIVYSFNDNLARRFDHPSLAGNSSAELTINGKLYQLGSPSDGIGLSHDTSMLYYSCISTPWLFSVPTSQLTNFTLSDHEIGQSVVNHGFKGFSDGFAFTSKDELFWGRNEIDGVWNIPQQKIPPHNTTQAPFGNSFFESNQLNFWIDTFAFDQQGSIWWTSNSLPEYIAGTMNFTHPIVPNMRIWKSNINQNSYLTGKPNPENLSCSINQ